MQTIRKFNLLLATTTIVCSAFTLLSFQAKADDRAHARKTPLAAATGKLTQASSASAEPMMRMPLVLPLFIQNQQFTSTLMIVNGSAESTYADVVLTGLDGKDINHRRVDFAPHSQRRVEVLDLLQEVASSALMGRITIMQSPDLKGMAVAAQLSISYQGSTQPSYIDEETAMPSGEGSQVLRAVADRSAGAPAVAVTSLSSTDQHVTMDCLSETGPNSSTTVDLGAQQTVVVPACQPGTGQSFDFAGIWNNDKSGPNRTVGISLSSDATPGSFAAFALAPHKKGNDRYFSAVNFSDPKMTGSNIIFAGVPVGSSLLLPAGKYVPQAALANFSARAMRVQIQYAQTIGDVPNVRSVRDLTLPAQSTKQLVLDDLQGGTGIQNSFAITSDGAPGDLMAKIVSTSESALHEVEVLAKDERSGNGGSHPWSLEQGNEATLLLFNPTTESRKFTVLASSEGVVWEKVYELAGMQTAQISIRSLILENTLDDKGKTLPAHSQGGLVEWFSEANGKGRLLESNKELAMARNFSCTGYYCICQPSFLPGTTYFSVSTIVGFGSMEANICQSPNPGPCCNQGSAASYNTSSASHSWSSGNTGVIQISGSSTSASVSTYGAGAGSTTVDGQMSYNSCTVSTFPSGYVGPYEVEPMATASQFTVSCTINGRAGSGWERNVTNQLRHIDGSPYAVSGITVADSLAIGRNDLGIHYTQTGSFTTTGDGSFPDTYYVCSTGCPGTGESDAQQSWTANGFLLPHINTVVYKCSSITIDGF